MKPNFTKLRDYGLDGKVDEWKEKNHLPIHQAFALKFSNDHKSLTHIAANHTNDLKSKTYQLIDQLITPKTDLVICEGLMYKQGLNPPNKWNDENESKHAVDVAIKLNIPYTGAEPSNYKINKYLFKEGIKKKDILLLVCLRVNLRCYRFKQDYKTFLHDINEIFIPHEKKILNYDESFDFEKYFEKRFGTKFIFGKFLDATAPNKKGKYITNKIAYLIDLMREKSIIKHLYKFLNKYDHIVIIYGMGHIYAEYPIFKETFDKVVKIK